MRHIRLAVSLLALLAVPVTSQQALAAWPHDPSLGNVGVCTLGSDQGEAVVISDGAGGSIMAWYDYRNGVGQTDVYAQRLSAAGVPLWTANGVPICTAASFQYGQVLVSDGAGGAIIAWQDGRSGSGYDIYAQRVNGAGVPQWTANGVPVCTATSNQLTPAIAQDGSGGAVIAWEDLRSGNTDLFAQRINASGTAQWTANGVQVTNLASEQTHPIIVGDAANGAYVAWVDYRNGNADVYAQRLSLAGSPQWIANGTAVVVGTGVQAAVVGASDGAGGLILAWHDTRNGGYDIYAQHLASNSNPLWSGLAVCTATGDQSEPAVTADGNGGVILAWTDGRSGTSDDIYAQRITAGGGNFWTADGVALCSAANSQSFPQVTTDGVGGAIVSWQDARYTIVTSDVFAQRVNLNGSTQWTFNGVAVSIASGSQTTPRIATDQDGGAVIAWYDTRSATSVDVYAQRVDRYGQLGDAEPAITGVKDVRNDQGGFVKVSWNASYLDADPTYGIFEYRVFRSVPAAAVSAVARRMITTDSDVAAREGALLQRTSAAATTYWEFVGAQTAEALPGYSRVCATTADSIAGSFPRTLFMVEARSSTSLTAPRWASAPDSGYSVDNLPPVAPAPFTGQYLAGQTLLHWNRNTEADLAGYRLYRGSSVAFVPGPANFVAQLPDTGTADAAGAPYVYKLTAVDSHGNESPVATLVPGGTLGVDDAPLALSFAAPSPNPARGASTLRWSLSRAGHVRVSVYDAAGRRVQVLRDADMEAGAHSAAFELRDESGRELSSGLYLVRFEAEGRVITRRLAAIR